MYEENDQKAIDQNDYSSCVSRLRFFFKVSFYCHFLNFLKCGKSLSKLKTYLLIFLSKLHLGWNSCHDNFLHSITSSMMLGIQQVLQ